MLKIIKYILFNLFRDKWIFIYFFSLLIVNSGITYFNRDEMKIAVSELYIILYVIPLVCIFFVSMHYYNSKEFIEMLLIQPLSRKKIIIGEYVSLVTALSISSLIGILLPSFINGISVLQLQLLIASFFLNMIFTGISLLVSVYFDEKARGTGLLLFIWLFSVLIYDGLMLAVFTLLSGYPLEKISLIMICLNPVDITRIYILLNLDISALLGYSGAYFKNFFGNFAGKLITFAIMLIWTVLPLYFTIRKFRKKDF